MASGKTINRNKLNLYLDIALALAFVVVMEVGFTGQRWHEDLGVAITIAFLVHIALHWRWIVGVSKHIFQRVLHFNEARFKYVLNLLVLVDMVVVIVTGLLISNTLGFYLPLGFLVYNLLRAIHIETSRLSLLLIGLHIAVDWRWIAASSRKHLFPFGSSAETTTIPDLGQSN
ncbi:MAG TPA: DUF4405 domain-containing protein [Ktedonobacterales bacterium]|jgi:hypothetical protein